LQWLATQLLKLEQYMLSVLPEMLLENRRNSSHRFVPSYLYMHWRLAISCVVLALYTVVYVTIHSLGQIALTSSS